MSERISVFTNLPELPSNSPIKSKQCVCCGRVFYAIRNQKYCPKAHRGTTCIAEHRRKGVELRKNLRRRRVRFQTLARFEFTCQYCGRKPPSVVLHIDHIVPVSKGGADVESNYTVACEDCNLGKGDVLLAA